MEAGGRKVSDHQGIHARKRCEQMYWLIRSYFQNLTTVFYGALAIGGLSAALAVYFSERPVVEVVKSPMAFAIGCNLIAAIYIAAR